MTTVSKVIDQAKREIDNKYSRKEYKKLLNQYLAKTFNYQNILSDIEKVLVDYKKEYEERKQLIHSFDKPTAEQLADKAPEERALLWLPYNNGKKIALLKSVLEYKIDIKRLRKVIRWLVEARIQSKGDEFIVDILANKGVSMQLIQLLDYIGFLSLRKGTSEKNRAIFMVTLKLEGIEDLIIKEKITSKNRVKFSVADEIKEDTFLISQKSWRYEQPKLSMGQIEALDKASNTWFSLREGLTEVDITKAVMAKLKIDKVTHRWQEIEINIAIEEFRQIMRAGNKFRLDRFQDGANRMYEKSTYFGFQQHKALRSMLRFHNKRVMTPEGVEELKRQIEAEPELADAMGWNEALANPSKPTGIIVYQDATTQGTQLFGVCTASPLLLAQGGAYDIGDELLVKAYELLSKELNKELSVFYTLQRGEVTHINCFTVNNVKSLHMTSLYNVGKERILTGKGFTSEDMEEIFEIEFEDRKNKLGKLQPLLKTAREAGLDIDKEKLYELFKKALWKIAGAALKAMDIINQCVDDETLVYKWRSILDNSINQYAMVASYDDKSTWVDLHGNLHTITIHTKVLEPKAKWRGLAARLIQSMDSDLVRYMYRGNVDLATIHDSYGSHPNDAKYVRDRYKDGLILLFRSDPLTRMLSDITGKRVKSLQNQEIDKQELEMKIRNSRYSLMY